MFMAPDIPVSTGTISMRPPSILRTASISRVPSAGSGRGTTHCTGTEMQSDTLFVMMSTEADMPDLSLGSVSVSSIVTSYSATSPVMTAASFSAASPTLRTVPSNTVSWRASSVTSAGMPDRTPTTSLSTSVTRTRKLDMSSILSRTVPGVFMVPTIAISPSSTFSAVTTPAIGEE